MRKIILCAASALFPVFAHAQALSNNGAIGPAPQTPAYIQVFTSSGTGTLPAYCTALDLTIVGGGQSGAPGGTIASGQSGSGGGGGGSGTGGGGAGGAGGNGYAVVECN